MRFNKCLKFLVYVIFFSLKLSASPHYEVAFQGLEDVKVLASVKEASQALLLQERAALSLLALQRRCESDIDNFIKVMHSQAYYNAKIDFFVDTAKEPMEVVFTFDAGPKYPLNFVEIICSDASPLSIDLGLVIGEPAYAEKILSAEEILLKELTAMGYPYAAITDRKVIADQQKKEISVKFYVDKGAICHFGKTIIRGNKDVKEEFIRAKVAWKEGETYSAEAVERTQAALEDTGLFSMTLISPCHQSQDDVCCFPMEIQLIEAKQRTIAAGASYTTQLGFGGTAEWEHRNICGAGEHIHTALNAWQKRQEAKVSYVLPDFGAVGQNLIWSALAKHEITDGYHETSFKASALFEHCIGDHLKLGYGGMYQAIFISHSANNDNGQSHVLKAPLFFHFSKANSLLDPTEGYTLNLKATPSLKFSGHKFGYCPALFTGTHYLPLAKENRLVFATKVSVGTIFGASERPIRPKASRRAIPPSELFYAGNENTLRGYSYMTVSPLNRKGKPIGGNSIGVLSFEARVGLTDKLGAVGFYEVGNVYKSRAPQIKHKQLQSAGVGLRYSTPVGPLRFDVALPLNRRKKIDGSYQLYISIGQSF